jgi:hypothetical protein
MNPALISNAKMTCGKSAATSWTKLALRSAHCLSNPTWFLGMGSDNAVALYGFYRLERSRGSCGFRRFSRVGGHIDGLHSTDSRRSRLLLDHARSLESELVKEFGLPRLMWGIWWAERGGNLRSGTPSSLSKTRYPPRAQGPHRDHKLALVAPWLLGRILNLGRHSIALGNKERSLPPGLLLTLLFYPGPSLKKNRKPGLTRMALG